MRHGDTVERLQVTRNAYNVFDNVIVQTNALGNTRRSEYNAAGILISETDAAGYSKSYRIDMLGHETAMVDELGHTRYKFYDAYGRLDREVDATGHEIRYTHDVFDRTVTVTVTDGLGALTAVEGDHTTRYHYDQRDRVVQTDLAQGWHLAKHANLIYEAKRQAIVEGPTSRGSILTSVTSMRLITDTAMLQ